MNNMTKKIFFALALIVIFFQPVNAVSPVLLSADGSTFSGPLLETWGNTYSNLTNNAVQLSYGMGGSGQGIASILNQTVDFAGSDAPLSTAQHAMADSNGKVINTIPETAGAIVMTYNLPTGLTGKLKLTAQNIAEIYQQNITWWNDSAITVNNPGLTYTGKITVVHRSDASGTSFAFSDYLTRAASNWHLGTSTSPSFPATELGANGNPGVATDVSQHVGSIGYVDLVYALKNNLSSATLQNKDGNWVTATTAGVTAAANSAANSLPSGTGDWANVSINNEPGADTYPIATFTYILVYKDLTNLGNAGAGMVAYFTWIMTNQAQQMGLSQGYVPLPANVLQANLVTIKSLQYTGILSDYEPLSTTTSSIAVSGSNSSTPGFEIVPFAGAFIVLSIFVLKRKKLV